MDKYKATIVFFLFAALGTGRDIYVATNGVGGGVPPFGAWETASSNIQWAVNAGTNSDTVWVSNGTYYLTNQITVSSNITIVGTGGVVAVNGNNANRCFYFNSGVTGTLANLFITGGYTNGSGGGVVFRSGIVSNCVFSNNVSTANGGGMQLLTSVSTIKDCVFVQNIASNGGGMDCSGIITTVVDHCQFLTNTAINGGGLYASSAANNLSLIVTGCDFICNVVTGYVYSVYNGKGGGVYTYFNQAQSLVNITHCTISSNVSNGNGGGVGMHNYTTLQNSFISNNIALTNGGGIFAAYGGFLVKKCVIARNISRVTGGNSGVGGVYVSQGSVSLLQDCTIEENSAGAGGAGVMMSDGSVGGILRNCLIRNNYGTNSAYGAFGGGMRLTGAATISGCTIVSNYAVSQGGGIWTTDGGKVENCIIYYNACGTAAYSNWYGISTNSSYTNCCTAPALTNGFLTNNITADPMCYDRAGGNYRLKTKSPCVNTGVIRDWMTNNAVDLDDRIRIRYGRVDMGAYEAFNEGTFYKFH